MNHFFQTSSLTYRKLVKNQNFRIRKSSLFFANKVFFSGNLFQCKQFQTNNFILTLCLIVYNNNPTYRRLSISTGTFTDTVHVK